MNPKRNDHRQKLCRALASGTAISGRGMALLAAPLALLLIPAAAQAQCSSSGDVTPTLTLDFSNRQFGTAPLPPLFTANAGANGCNGANAGDDDNGGAGSPAETTGLTNVTAQSVSLLGRSGSDGVLYWGGRIISYGGVGGTGGQAGQPVVSPVTGGAGGTGGGASKMTINASLTIGPDSAGVLADIGFEAAVIGGAGGLGGTTGSCCSGFKGGGAGGAGGGTGGISFTGTGEVKAAIGGIAIGSVGGNGGMGGGVITADLLNDLQGGAGGNGGASGPAALTWTADKVKTVEAQDYGLFAYSYGGNGGAGGAPGTTGGRPAGAAGGDGGAGAAAGDATLIMAGGGVIVGRDGSPTITNGAVIAQSIGGTGGAGSLADSSLGSRGGKGGAGSNAGSASATILGTVIFGGNEVSPSGAAVVVSNGGAGGAGGEASAIAGSAGGGGLAGTGGAASLVLGSATQRAILDAVNDYSSAAVVQSVGGGGGTGGIANAGFNTQGGAGAAGGNGGNVSVNAVNTFTYTIGRSGSGIIAQSVGGGGGLGGDANAVSVGASLAIGGNGGLGGNGAAVNVALGSNSIVGSLGDLGDAGLLAQSIGGSGGTAGSASSRGVAFLTMAVGGDASGGGTGGAVTLKTDGIITTYGDHGAGVRGQSIGGGGGDGGSGFAFGVGVLPTAAVAVGGRGGSGGPAGTVSLVNTGQITSYGPDAFGVQLQSIGGGGGSGGAAAARAIALSPDKRIPAISIAVAVGGAGGSGNTGGKVDLTNTNLVLTAGHGATAVFAQSVGGGGGNGGDSTAASYAGGPQAGIAVSVATAVGGSGGSGGLGGAVTLANSGLIATLGQDSYGVLAQSVGGGGGMGGTGDASAAAKDSKTSFAASIAVGGSGGTGGHAGEVKLTNSTGSITTSGDGADAVFAQTIGGGGGIGSGGVGSAAGGKLAVSVGVGGSGGAGGNGATTIVNTGGDVITRGTDAVGIFAQSVGGGGGKGGKGGATAGGVTDLSNAQALSDTLAGGFNGIDKVTQIGDRIYQVGEILEAVKATKDELTGLFKQPQAPEPGEKEAGEAIQINVAVAVGGKGGAAGKGGDVSVENTGTITTFGAQSDAIFAQSVGGGGGKGGGATSTGSASDEGQYQTAIAVGGNGAGGGDGGQVIVFGDGTTILTQGVGAFGISAHSVGGGGGAAKAAGAVSGSLKSMSVGLGGNGGAAGNGGAVSVNLSKDKSLGTVTTTGKHGVAIFAQSVGAGGGIVHTMTSDQTFDPAKIAINPQGRIADVHGYGLLLGGQNGASGKGGTVDIQSSGVVRTSGLGAHGMVAQSLGGGGGLVVGGQLGFETIPGGPGSAAGNGDKVSVYLEAGSGLTTGGDGAFGVIAQSVGGGGGIAGDFSKPTTLQPLVALSSGVRSGSGSAGAVDVSLTGTSVQTSGTHAHGIVAQSVGGGGGLIATVDVLQAGTAGGSGTGGAVNVTLLGSQVSATGIGSAGILAQSDGSAKSSITIAIDSKSSVVGGGLFNPNVDPRRYQEAIADIRVLGGNNNVITNAGLIGGFADNYSGLSIILINSLGDTKVTNTGTIVGIIDQTGSKINMSNGAGGVLASRTINLGSGTLANDGLLHVGGIGKIGKTDITGNLVQGAGGRLVIDADLASGTADLLAVTGKATIAGTVEVRSATTSNRPITILTATDGITLDPMLAAPSGSTLFSYEAALVGQALQIGTNAQFASSASALGNNHQLVAGHLQSLFDSGASYDAGFTALAGVNGSEYADTLDALSGQSLGAIGALRFEQSNGFVEQLITGCGAFESSSERGTSCGWARMIGATTDLDESGDSLGFRSSTGLFQLGYEAGVGGDWSASGSLAYSFEQIDGDNALSRISGESVVAGAFLRYHPGPLQLTFAADAGYGWYDSRRQVNAGTVSGVTRARPEAWHIGGHAEASYRFETGRLFFRPFAKLHVVHATSKGFAEAGLPQFNLEVESASNTAISGSAGLEISGNMPVKNGGYVRPFIRASYVLHSNNDWDTTARFADQPEGTPSFTVNTRSPERLTRLAVGLNILHAERIELSLQYAPEFGSDYSRHAGVARLTARF